MYISRVADNQLLKHKKAFLLISKVNETEELKKYISCQGSRRNAKVNANISFKGGNDMSRVAVLELIAACLLIGLFSVSWLVSKSIQLSDWLFLAAGILNLFAFVLEMKKNKA